MSEKSVKNIVVVQSQGKFTGWFRLIQIAKKENKTHRKKVGGKKDKVVG